jgi:glycosyltransferase involved in cell wall biosynthesis
MAFAHDDPGLHPPEEVDFSDLPNVLHLPPTPDIREVYGQTRILLFPALWDEAFGRAVLEALANGIPVLATRAGGITETGLHFGGAFFDRDSGMEAWATEILRLDSPDAYSHACAMALEEIRWYNLNAEIAHLEAIIGDCIERRGLPW